MPESGKQGFESLRVIVTGASRGIGAGVARVLARAGHRVGLLARSRPELEALSREIEAAGGRSALATADLRDRAATESAIDALARDLDGVDALINNAGLVLRKDALSIHQDEWRDLFDTNVHGVFHATRAVLPRLVAQGRGHVVMVSSISGYHPLPGGSGYAATKYAVTGFAESLFHEVRDLGVKVSVVFPGSVDSASHRHQGADGHWKVRPDEVGDAVRSLLETSPGNCISRLEIRPLRRPPPPAAS